MRRFTRHLYFWVLVAIFCGGLIGYLFPDVGVKLKPFGDGFISLVKMLIGPIIFCTVVLGVAGSGDMKKVGRVGGKALLYFEVISTFALAIGLLVIRTTKPGSGLNIDPATLDAKAVAGYAKAASNQSTIDFVLHLIPKTFVDAFTANGDLLQVLLISILFGYSVMRLGKESEFIFKLIRQLSHVLFAIMNTVMKVAPIGAGGAMAFTIGKYGISTLGNLAELMLTFYLTCILFVVFVLGTVCLICKVNLFRFLHYIKDELLTVLGTSSSETVLVPLMEKLERAGCPRPIVGLVVPAGYSFNLDGTNIYITMAALFIAQALNIDLTLQQELTLLGVAMLTSKGASGVVGAGFITLAATLAVIPTIPVAGLALILGIDRFMAEARALTNCVGNAIACIAVSRWEGEFDLKKHRHALNKGADDIYDTPVEAVLEDEA